MKIASTLPAFTVLLTLVGFVLSVSALRFDVGRAAYTMWITTISLFVMLPIANYFASRQDGIGGKARQANSDLEENETSQPTFDTPKRTAMKPETLELKTQPIEQRSLRIRPSDPEALRQLRQELELSGEENLYR